MQGSIVAIITPFDAANCVDGTALRFLIERQIEAGTDAIVVCGTTGESPTLSTLEQREIIEESIRMAAGRIPIIAGIGTYCTRSSVENAKHALRAGASASLVIFPYYNRPTFLGLKSHIEEIAKVGLPLIPYHHPGRTGVRLSAHQLAEITQISEVVSIKDCSGDMDLLTQLIDMTEKPILTGDDPQTIALMAMGGKGVISVMANVVPKAWKEMVDFCAQNNFSAARDIFYRLYPLCRAIMAEVNPQGIKYAMSLLGCSLASLRLPLIEVQESVQEEIEREMEKLGLISQISTSLIG